MTNNPQKSEFKIKGTNLIVVRKYFEMEFGSEFATSKFSAYYPQTTILASSWYLAAPAIQLIYECATEKKINFRELMLKMTAFALETDLNGVYKFLMKLGGLNRILGSLPQLGNFYTDWVETKVIKNVDGCLILEYIIPKQFEEYIINAQEGAMIGIFNVFNRKMRGYIKRSIDTIIKSDIEYSRFQIVVEY